MDMLNRFSAAVAGLLTIPKFPPGRSASVPNELEPERFERARDSRSGLSFFIIYDGGSLSHRRITIKRLEISENTIQAILAFCHERRALRMFRTDRIREAVDIETGEVLTSNQLCTMLQNRGIPVAERRLAAMIKILVFMARCDGHEHYLEWEEIDRFVVRLSRCLTDDETSIEHILADARRLCPDGTDFVRALKGLTKTRLPARMHEELKRAIGAVIDADGILQEEEVRWAVEASEFIARMPVSG